MLTQPPPNRQHRSVEILTGLLSKDLSQVNRVEQSVADLAPSKSLNDSAVSFGEPIPKTKKETVSRAKSTRNPSKHIHFSSGGGGGREEQKSRAVQTPPQPRRSQSAHTKRRDSMLAARGKESRRERTFVGGECAVCEEPLEHTLRGERILQLSCGHVTHQACFHEYMQEPETPQCPTCDAPMGLDPSRGGAADFDNLHKMIKTVTTHDNQEQDEDNVRERWSEESLLRHDPPQPPPKQLSRSNTADFSVAKSHPSQEWRKEDHRATPSAVTSADARAANVGRRRDYDNQSVDSAGTSARASPPRNPIPAPVVTVRSEYPTLSKSKQQQSLTCLVTVEVLPGKWSPATSDLRPQRSFEEPSEASPRKLRSYPSRSQAASERTVDTTSAEAKHLNDLKDELFSRVDNWHGLDYSRFGKLHLHGTMKVSKDKQSWQQLECYLFTQMLICVKEKKDPHGSQDWAEGAKPPTKYALKGSILVKRHLQEVEYIPGQQTLSLSLSVVELPYFHLQFRDSAQLEIWKKALSNVEPHGSLDDGYDATPSNTDEEDADGRGHRRRLSTLRSSSHGGANRSPTTAPTEYTNPRISQQDPLGSSLHVPLDLVIVFPVSSTMHGLKLNLLKDALRFVVANLGDRDRLALVTFGSDAGGVPLVGMTGKSWNGWTDVLDGIRPDPSKNQRADVVDGANVAMDLLMQRKSSNPLSSILLISDSATSEVESVDFVVSRAEAAKITIHSFGLGLTHKPDTMVELSTRTKGAYSFVKDWMMLRECLAGCLGALQTTSHQNVKLKLHLPEGSTAKFVKISGALQITKRATGRDAEACLGDLRFGDKRDVLIQLTIPPDTTITDDSSSDPWEHIISNLEALGGTADSEDMRGFSIEEMPLIQADLTWGDLLKNGETVQLPRQSLLAITMLPHHKKGSQPITPPIPPHPSIVQRRMELLTSDMLSRALTLVSRNQYDRASHLLTETRSILRGLGKGSLPPVPPASARNSKQVGTATPSPENSESGRESHHRTPTPPRTEYFSVFAPASGVDQTIVTALDKDIESALEFIQHPAVFNRDSRKAVLQEIGVISSQRGIAFRSPVETLWAQRISGVQRLLEKSKDWRQTAEQT